MLTVSVVPFSVCLPPECCHKKQTLQEFNVLSHECLKAIVIDPEAVSRARTRAQNSRISKSLLLNI